jgi:hypothetical protein
MEQNFKKFGLLLNTEKTEAMIMTGSKPVHSLSEDAYKRMITGNGESYQEKQKMTIKCEFCNTEVQIGSKAKHQLSKKCKKAKNNQQTNNESEVSYCRSCTQSYDYETSNTMIIPRDNDILKCKYDKCMFDTNKPDRMRRHYRARHPNDIVIIEEEGILPQCLDCGLFQKNVYTEKHKSSEDCRIHMEKKNKRRQEIRQQASRNVEFFITGKKIKKVTNFKYLGRIINNEDEDLPAVEKQLMKARMTWGRIGKLLKKKTKSNPKVMSIFYKVIIQSVLLYGSESWVLTNRIKNKLNSFHRRCSRYITGRHIRLVNDVWIYPDSAVTLEMADLLPIEEYIEKRKSTVCEYTMSTDIFKRCETIGAHSRISNQKVWWKNVRKENEETVRIVTEIPCQNGSG